MRIPLLVITTAIVAAYAPSRAPAASPLCPPPPTSRAGLDSLKRSGFVVSDAGERNRLAISLLSCFDHPDPALRDGIVFEGLSHWLRGNELEPATIRALAERLMPALRERDDSAGFRKPFAALLLSEVARADRIGPVLADSAREAFVAAAAGYLVQIADYRGFDPVEGWRHGVAHGADLILQLGVNPRVSADGVQELLHALARQVAPARETFYTFGEPERFARAVFFVHRRGVLEDAYWDAWFAAIGDPAPLANWGAAAGTLEGLARRHNAIAFMHAAAFAGRAGGDEAGARLTALAHRETVRLMGG